MCMPVYDVPSLQFVVSPDEEFCISVCWYPGKPGPEGWGDGWRWHLDCQHGDLFDAPDLDGKPYGSPMIDVDHWLVPLTGYTRAEFLTKFGPPRG